MNKSTLIRNVEYLKGDTKQAPYAKAVGVDQASISRLLAGKVSPSLDTVQAIARYHGVTLDDLVNRDLQAVGPSPSQSGRISADSLAVALVAVERAIRARNLDPAESWGKLAKLVIWALELQHEEYPDGLKTKADQRGFDARVELEMTRGGYRAIEQTGQDVARGAAGTGGPPPHPSPARSSRGGRNP